MCVGDFELILQVTSTLWPDIKSQKLSEHRFRLRWTKSDTRTQFKQVKTGQPQRGSDKEAQDSPPEEVGGGWWLRKADRPTWSATWPVGPTASTRARGASPLVPYVGCASFTPWLPAINTRRGRGWRIGHTHTHTTHHSPLLSCIPCIVFRLSGV